MLLQIVELPALELIILSDSKDFPWCRCEEEQAWAPLLIALSAPSRQFEVAATAFSRRLHNFFIVEELSCPSVPPVDVARVARVAYMHGWHARAFEARIQARVAACAAPRRSCRIAQRDL